MQGSLLQPDEKRTGITFDPRTKMFLLLTVAVFVLGGAGGKNVDLLAPMLCALPVVLFLLAGKWKRAFTYALIYTAAYLCFWYFGPRTTGIVNFLLLAICGILSRFLPGIMLGMYLIETTTVSEFTAAMSKMHVTDKIAIPLSVMFRFFPTVADEFPAGRQKRDENDRVPSGSADGLFRKNRGRIKCGSTDQRLRRRSAAHQCMQNRFPGAGYIAVSHYIKSVCGMDCRACSIER